jgi:hypothetical protein
VSTPARLIAANPLAAGLATGEATTDRIEWVKLHLTFLPLATPISDAKVLTGRQKPLTEIALWPTSWRASARVEARPIR